MAHFEVSSKVTQVRFYEEHPDKYLACFQLYLDGDRGFLYSLMGDKFYEKFSHLLPEVMKECGIKTIEASVGLAHFRHIKKSLNGIATVEISGEAKVANRDMIWILISISPPKDDGLKHKEAHSEE